MTGEEANAAYEKAKALAMQGKYDEARAVEMLPSDRTVIERRITEHTNANTTKGKQ